MKMMMGAPLKYQPKCLIASMGQEYLPGCKESIHAAANDLEKHGCGIVFVGIHDINQPRFYRGWKPAPPQ